MRKFVLFLLILFPVAALSFSGLEIERYYQHKDLYEAKSMLQSLSDQNILDKNAGITPLISGFVGGLMAEHPSLINQLKEMPLSASMKKLVERVNKNMRNARYKLDSYLDIRQITTPPNIDTLWGLFYATGDARIPTAIQNYIVWKSQSLSDTEVDMTSLLALSSLQTNAAHHPLAKLAFNRTIQSPSVQHKLSLLQGFDQLSK